MNTVDNNLLIELFLLIGERKHKPKGNFSEL